VAPIVSSWERGETRGDSIALDAWSGPRFGAFDLLERLGYVRKEHALARVVKLASGLTMVALVPLLLVWAAVAFRQRGR
jgi:hypothetical protein